MLLTEYLGSGDAMKACSECKRCMLIYVIFIAAKTSPLQVWLFSLHVQHHEVWILNQLLESLPKPCAGRPVDDSVIRADAEVDHVGLLYAEAILFRIIVD